MLLLQFRVQVSSPMGKLIGCRSWVFYEKVGGIIFGNIWPPGLALTRAGIRHDSDALAMA